MGNIHLFKSIGGVEEKVRLCVYCNDPKPKDNVLTVVNPDSVLVKMEPHQILHIVNYDDLGRQVRWSLDNPDSLKCVRCETVINDFQKVYDEEALFCPEPRSHGMSMNETLKNHPPQFFKNEVIGNRGLTTEYHFWSCLTAAEINKMYTAANGSYPIGTVSIQGEFEDRCSIRRFEVMLCVRGKRKLNLEHFKAIYSIAKCWNERHLSYLRHSIFNPRINENLDVSDSDGWFYVEIPSPSVYFEDFSSDCEWKSEDPVGTMQCHELKGRHINGNLVQRFLITGITNRKDDNLMSLGTLIFHSSDRGVTKQMSLCFWKIPSSHLGPFLPKRAEEEMPRRGSRNRLDEYFEIELEIINDGVLAEDDAITPLCYIDENAIDYSEMSEEYVRNLIESKKKCPLLLGVSSNSSTTALVPLGMIEREETIGVLSARSIAF
jgi:hypothetical protein